MHAISKYDSINSFSHTGKIITFQTLTNKQNKFELTGMIDFGEFPSLSLENPSVVTSIQYSCYRCSLCDDNESGSGVNKLPCRMFTKKSSSRDRLPAAL